MATHIYYLYVIIIIVIRYDTSTYRAGTFFSSSFHYIILYTFVVVMSCYNIITSCRIVSVLLTLE